MKRIYFLLFLFASMSIATSCEVSNEDEQTPKDTENQIANTENEDAILIRIENISNDTFETIFVDTSGGQADYDGLNSSDLSNYKEFNLAYYYAYIEVQIDSSIYKIQPADYVGETPLEPGKYTYVLDTNEENTDEYDKLELSFRVD